jgi:hypothetical protein
MPYLIRRAEENTSVAGQTSRELGLIKAEQKGKRIVSAGIKKSFDSTSKPFFLLYFSP